MLNATSDYSQQRGGGEGRGGVYYEFFQVCKWMIIDEIFCVLMVVSPVKEKIFGKVVTEEETHKESW